MALSPAEDAIQLRFFLDRSIVEVFANEPACTAPRIYPTPPDSVGVELFVEDGTPEPVRIRAWDMRPAW